MSNLDERLGDLIDRELTKPVYFRVSPGEDGRLVVEQVAFLRSHDLAEMLHVEERTIRNWTKKNLIPSFKAPGSSVLLFDLNEVIRALRSGAVESSPAETGQESRVGLSIAEP